MKAPTNKEQRAARDADFKRRLQPRLLWNSTEDGPAICAFDEDGKVTYAPKPIIKKKSRARKLTEAEDNAIGRALRRRANRRARNAGKPHSAR